MVVGVRSTASGLPESQHHHHFYSNGSSSVTNLCPPCSCSSSLVKTSNGYDAQYNSDGLCTPRTETTLADTTLGTKRQQTSTKLLKFQLPNTAKLVLGAGGIYASFLYVASVQEDLFSYVDRDDGTMFDQAWLLQMLESMVSMFVGVCGVFLQRQVPRTLPLRYFWWSGAAQVTSKACSNMALAAGLSYPVMILAKSCKLLPVMMGALFMGGATYETREYLQVAAIMGGTILVLRSRVTNSTLASSPSTSMLALLYITLSLALDGAVAGLQKRLQTEMAQIGSKPDTWDFMFWMSVPMALISGLISVANGELSSGIYLCIQNSEIRDLVVGFSLCSTLGQVFIYYTLSHFDPLVVSTVTTTRKIFSALLSIFLKEHILNPVGWVGVGLASTGVILELDAKRQQQKRRDISIDKGKSLFRSSFGY